MDQTYRLPVIAAVLMVGVALSGCGQADPDAAIAKVNETNLQRVANLYFTYQMKHNWRGPADEASFKKFLREYNPRKLERIGVDPAAIDELFISQRDGEPFKIRYGLKGSAMGSSEPVVFESMGVDGQRRVGFLNMEQRDVDEAEYNALWSGKAAPAQETARPR
jgi:hypothetical protein